ncbi:MAG: hypothetical protein C0606_13530 [Hyphomicrobiales bacterium]|nr:MAG: hypothetical protein C0606_13530 [Hyphomicrobiales bacterium]
MNENNTLSAPEAAIFIERMCSELRNLAAGADMNFLAYLLDVAREEAVQQAGAIRVTPNRSAV